MPRLDSQIPLESHKPDCPNPTAKRLGIRDYDERGNQKWTAWGLICENCGVVIKQPYKHNPTKKQRDKRMSMPKLPFKILNEDAATRTTNQKLSKEEIDSRHRKFLKERKIRQMKQKEAASAQMGRLEKKARNKVKALNTIYKNDRLHCPGLKGRIIWDEKLVERFLAIRPTYEEMVEVLDYPPLYRNTVRRANKRRGWIIDPENTSQVIPDPDYFTHLKPKPVSLYNPNKLGKFEKMVINEADGRMEAMKIIINKHHESKIQVHYLVQDEKQIDLKNKIKKF